MADVLSPVPKFKAFDSNGNPLVGGLLFTYAAGTSTKIATYINSSGITTNSNPVVLDFRGECDLWIPPNTAYKYVLAPSTDTDPPSNPIWSVDQLVSAQLLTLYGGVDTGSANAYVLNYTANFTTYTDGTIIYWIPSNTNTGGSTLNVNGLGAVPVLTADGFGLGAGDIIANQITAVLYRSGSFFLLSVSATTGSFTGTFTGCTTTVTGTIFYKIAGGICTLYISSNIFGLSNTNAMTMTGIPAVCRPSTAIQVPCEVLNNSVAQLGAIAVQPGGSANFQTYGVNVLAVVPAGFTAANNKGIQVGWSVTYPL